MRLIRYANVKDFYEAAEDYFVAREAFHNLHIGICQRLLAQPHYSSQPPYFALVRSPQEILAAGLMTPPHNLVLAHSRSEAALSMIADDIQQVLPPPGVLGARFESLSFAQLWQDRTGQSFRLNMAERIYQLEKVVPPQGVPGRLRAATMADRDLMIDWFHAFSVEALHDGDRVSSERAVDLRMDVPAISNYFWDDVQPVSFCGIFRGTPNGARIGPVYTPPHFRGRGYASACVAAASQVVLDEGRRYCFLFTDLSNPTSNHIYQSIGYQPVVDIDEYRFAAPSAE